MLSFHTAYWLESSPWCSIFMSLLVHWKQSQGKIVPLPEHGRSSFPESWFSGTGITNVSIFSIKTTTVFVQPTRPPTYLNKPLVDQVFQSSQVTLVGGIGAKGWDMQGEGI